MCAGGDALDNGMGQARPKGYAWHACIPQEKRPPPPPPPPPRAGGNTWPLAEPPDMTA